MKKILALLSISALASTAMAKDVDMTDAKIPTQMAAIKAVVNQTIMLSSVEGELDLRRPALGRDAVVTGSSHSCHLKCATAAPETVLFIPDTSHSRRRRACRRVSGSQFFAGSGQGRMTISFKAIL